MKTMPDSTVGRIADLNVRKNLIGDFPAGVRIGDNPQDAIKIGDYPADPYPQTDYTYKTITDIGENMTASAETDGNSSGSHNNLTPEYISALVELQHSIGTIVWDTKGWQMEYASLSAIIKAIREPMYKWGFAYQVEMDGDNVIGRLLHKSGGYCSSSTSLLSWGGTLRLEEEDIKEIGAVKTYFRRYLLIDLLNLATGKDADARDTAPAVKANAQPMPRPIETAPDADTGAKKAINAEWVRRVLGQPKMTEHWAVRVQEVGIDGASRAVGVRVREMGVLLPKSGWNAINAQLQQTFPNIVIAQFSQGLKDE